MFEGKFEEEVFLIPELKTYLFINKLPNYKWLICRELPRITRWLRFRGQRTSGKWNNYKAYTLKITFTIEMFFFPPLSLTFWFWRGNEETNYHNKDVKGKASSRSVLSLCYCCLKNSSAYKQREPVLDHTGSVYRCARNLCLLCSFWGILSAVFLMQHLCSPHIAVCIPSLLKLQVNYMAKSL